MESYGATNRNDRYGWAFVNHADKVVIFGAWDVHTEPDRALIMSTDWERNESGRKQNAYGEAIEYIRLVENEGYALKTFPMILGEEYDKKTGTTRAKIKDYIAVVSDMSLEVINGDYYAVGNHDVRVSRKAPSNVAQDVTDIFDKIVEKTERESMVLARIGQGKFRQML